MKARDASELDGMLGRLLERCDLEIAQEFLPTQFDWRIGVWNGKALWACKYHMAESHWQIVRHGAAGSEFGTHDTVPVEHLPGELVELAVKASRIIGDGLYGIDINEANGSFYVIEVNDNPNIDAGVEDAVLGDQLYGTIVNGFLKRLERQRSRPPRKAAPPSAANYASVTLDCALESTRQHTRLSATLVPKRVKRSRLNSRRFRLSLDLRVRGEVLYAPPSCLLSRGLSERDHRGGSRWSQCQCASATVRAIRPSASELDCPS